MPEKPLIPAPTGSDCRIFTLRGQKVILDTDLAALYGVPTKRLNEQVKRNLERFPPDFLFQLTAQEVVNLKSQIATSSSQPAYGKAVNRNQPRIATASAHGGHGGRRKAPHAFTEHGAIMAATVLNSPRAMQMSVFVVRAFIRMRTVLTDTHGLARKLAALEKELKARLDDHESAIVDTLRRLMEIIDPPASPEPPRKQIGFQVKERRSTYRARREAAKP